MKLKSNGKLKKCKEELESKATRALHNIMHNVKISYNTSTKTYLKLFESLIEPILLYGAEIWGLSTLPPK